MEKYKKLENDNKFETGDLLLYHHRNTCSSLFECFMTVFTNCIMCCTNSKYSHTAVIIKDPPWREDLKGYYIIESSYETFPESEDHEKKLGVELVPLDKAIEESNCDIYWRHINCVRDEEFYQNLIEAHSVAHNRPYDLDPFDWIKAKFKLRIGNVRRKDTFYCSALASFIYVKLGLLRKSTDWTLVSPEMLGTEHKKDELQFINCTIEPEVRIN